MYSELINHLETFVTERRKALFNKVLGNRTRYITVALEDIYQPHNASAVLRTCDCFGIQDLHIIENRNSYQINPDVTLGSDKWLTLHKYCEEQNNSLSAIRKLRDEGYRIVATTPHKDSVSLRDFDLGSGKFALFFGTELEGLTDTLLTHADEFLRIPLYGFTESYNISVSAAIILHTLSERMRHSSIDWQLPDEEMKEVKLTWLRRSIRNSHLIEKEFLSKNPHIQNIASKGS